MILLGSAFWGSFFSASDAMAVMVALVSLQLVGAFHAILCPCPHYLLLF